MLKWYKHKRNNNRFRLSRPIERKDNSETNSEKSELQDLLDEQANNLSRTMYDFLNNRYYRNDSNNIFCLHHRNWDKEKEVIDLVIERKYDDDTIHFFIIKDADADSNTDDYTVEDFNNAPELTENDYIFSYIQDYCERHYQKSVKELATPSIPTLQKKIEALEKRIARLEEYADAIDMVAELINDVFPE